MKFLGLIFGAIVAVLPMLASADVIEISEAGDIQTFSGPTLFRAEGARTVRDAMGLDHPKGLERDAPAPPSPPVAEAPSNAFRAPAHYIGYFQAAAARYQVDPTLIDAIANQESGFRGAAVSPKGAIGIMQLMPGTAQMLGVNPWDVRQNIEGGTAYIRAMLDRFGGNQALALAAYNAGPEAVARHRGIPPYAETQAYVRRIQADLALRASALAKRAGGSATPNPRFGDRL